MWDWSIKITAILGCIESAIPLLCNVTSACCIVILRQLKTCQDKDVTDVLFTSIHPSNQGVVIKAGTEPIGARA